MRPENIKSAFKGLWWAVVVTGIIAVIFGLLTIIWPGITLGILIYIFSICVIAIGVINLVKAINAIKTDKLWWMTLLFALVCTALGAYLLLNPPATMALFAILLSIFIFAQSLIDLIVASYATGGKWPWTVIGVVGIIFGFVVMFWPEAASLTFVWVLGVYALAHGVIALVYAFRIRGGAKKVLKKSEK